MPPRRGSARQPNELKLDRAICAAVAFTNVRKPDDELGHPKGKAFAVVGGVAIAAVLGRAKFRTFPATTAVTRVREGAADPRESLWERMTAISLRRTCVFLPH